MSTSQPTHAAQLMKQAGIFDTIGKFVSPVLPQIGNSVGEAIHGAGDLAKATLGSGRVSSGLSHAGNFAKDLGTSVASADPASIGKYTAGGAAGLGALGVYGHMTKKPEEQMQVQAAAEKSIGTPFVDGVLAYCIEQSMDAAQVVDLLEKGAAATDRTGQECRDFLERLSSK